MDTANDINTYHLKMDIANSDTIHSREYNYHLKMYTSNS